MIFEEKSPQGLGGLSKTQNLMSLRFSERRAVINKLAVNISIGG